MSNAAPGDPGLDERHGNGDHEPVRPAAGWPLDHSCISGNESGAHAAYLLGPLIEARNPIHAEDMEHG